MVKNKVRFIINMILSILQIVMITAVVLLERYSTQKMGVARYLTYKKMWFENKMFTPSLNHLYVFIFILGAVICFGILVRSFKRNGKIGSFLVAVVANIIGVIILLFNTEFAAYHFFILVIMAVVAIQYVKAFFINTK